MTPTPTQPNRALAWALAGPALVAALALAAFGSLDVWSDWGRHLWFEQTLSSPQPAGTLSRPYLLPLIGLAHSVWMLVAAGWLAAAIAICLGADGVIRPRTVATGAVLLVLVPGSMLAWRATASPLRPSPPIGQLWTPDFVQSLAITAAGLCALIFAATRLRASVVGA